MIAHIVYFETLASINDEESQAWKSAIAGLVVLRLIDEWLDSGAQTVTTDITGLRAIHDAIGEISEGDPLRSILSGTVNALQQAESASVSVIASHLMAYGRALHYNGQWGLARDVFTTLLKRAEAAEESETYIQAALRLGFVNRRMNEFDESESAYMMAEEEALRSGNPEGVARAKLGIAQNATERGNLPQADELLEEVVTTAEKSGLWAVLSDALHDRARLSHLRKDYASAVRYGYNALEFAQDLLARDRILGDVAACFAELGNLSAAKDAHLIVAATTQEEWLRQQTLLNLMEIAILERQETVFHGYRKMLADTVLQPTMLAYFHLYSGKGYRAFHSPSKAEAAFDKAIEIAQASNQNQLLFLVEEEKQKVVKMEVQDTAPNFSPEIKEIASAIGQLRMLTEADLKSGTTV